MVFPPHTLAAATVGSFENICSCRECSAARGGHHYDVDLPFELRCLEAALQGAIDLIFAETAALEHSAQPVINRASHKAGLNPE